MGYVKNVFEDKKLLMRLMLILLSFVILTSLVFVSADNYKFKLNDKGDDSSQASRFSKIVEQEKFAISVKDVGEFKESQSDLKVELEETEGQLFGGDNDSGWYFNGKIFDTLPSKDQRELLRQFTDDCTRMDLDTDSMGYVEKNIQAQSSTAYAVVLPMIAGEVSADLLGAFRLFAPFQSPVGIFLGVIAIVLIVAVIGTTGVDMFFLGVPAVQTAGLESKDRTGSKPVWVTGEAWSALKTSEASIENTGGKFKNAMLIYLKRRAMTYIFLLLAIFYLIAGQLAGLIAGLLKLTSGFSIE